MSGTVRIGVYIIPPVQFLDVSPIDVIASLSKEYVADTPLPDHVKAHAIDVSIKYITPEGPQASQFARITASAALRVDHSIKDPEVQPGSFDLILIPGPPPAATFTEEQLDFVRRHFNDGKGATIMSVCTGSLIVAASGIANGRQASAPRGLLPDFRKKYPKATWIDKRWVKDPSGKLWMSGGVTNGQDMMAAYCREHFPGAFTDMILAMADVGERPQEYNESSTRNTAWWVFKILRAWFGSGSKAGGAVKAG